jgi:hypothetical protein
MSNENRDLELEGVIVEEVFENGEIVEVAVIEEYAKRGEKPPRAKRYVLRIDKEIKETSNPHPNGREILSSVGKNSDTSKLYQIFRGHQPVPVGPDEVVDLTAPGVERFTTVPKDPTEGYVAADLRREVALPEGDIEFLDSLNLRWETVKGPNETVFLLLNGWKIPEGYNVEVATLLLILPKGYPDTQIDMAHFSPALSRVDGKGINNLSPSNWAVGNFQQWSRHRTNANPWRPSIDDISTHLSLVDDWLRREFGLR